MLVELAKLPRTKPNTHQGHIWHQGHFGHYKGKMCAKVKIVFVFHLLPPPNSVLLLPPWKARGLVLNSFEIDRTYHRLVRQNRTLDTNFVSVSEHPVAEYSDSVHSVAFPNFDHSVHSENMAQPPTPPGPRERTLRESIIDAASGGSLGDMTPFEARCLIEKMASNSQQFNARSGDAIVVRGVHDVGTNAARQDKLETKIDSLTTLITQLAINQQKSSMARVCGICTSRDHYNDMCPSLLEPRTGDHPKAYAANIYNNRPPHQQQHYDPPSSSTYNPGWRNQVPFQNNNVGQNRSYVPPPIQQQRHQMINNPAPTEPSLEELVRQMTMQNMQFQQETRASIQTQESSIQNLTTQMGQMATSLNTLQSQNSNKLPSQTVLNPRNVSAITLRSGKQTEVPTPRTNFVLQKEHDASKRNKSVLEENENTTRETHANQPSSKIRQQSDLFVQVQAATKPNFATFFPSVLQAPDWTSPFDLECDTVVYALGTVLASYEFDFLPP
ncbi:hypothetical protein Lal_00027940 [Lupinus albus]|nr:hypothetical protein Lal_00027940 [Lupinus albus]